MSTEAIFWLVVMVLFLILEMVTISLVSIWFVGGSLAAFLVSFVVNELWIEVLVFLGVSLLLLFLLRPMARKFGVKQTDPADLHTPVYCLAHVIDREQCS